MYASQASVIAIEQTQTDPASLVERGGGTQAGALFGISERIYERSIGDIILRNVAVMILRISFQSQT